MTIFFNRYLLWPLLLTGHFLAASLLAWQLLAQINFAYPLGYQLLDIKQHIQHYGPLNHYKPEFGQTTPKEHQQLFAEITDAVQNHGHGLAEISYRLPNGTQTPLMREAEVIHLQDVANLIDIFYLIGAVGFVIWLVLLAYSRQQKQHFPSLKKILIGFGLGLTVIAAGVLLIGSKAVFYWLHVQIFPDNHEWFFFYQDSLMTTLMKAPDLFGFITVILVLVFAVIWAVSVWGMQKGLAATQVQQTAAPTTAKKTSRKKKR
jgi:hypothetical protein